MAAATSILILGAGVAGLKAAADLATRGFAVTVLEARDRIGGRVWTENTPTGPLELGAQWIHGTANPIMALAKQQGWQVLPSAFGSGEDFEALDATKAWVVPSKDQAAFGALLDELTDYIESQQENDGSGNGRSLASAIEAFKKQKKLDARQSRGLDQAVDGEWTQEYASDPEDLSLNWFDNDDPLKGGDSILAKGYTATLIDYLTAALKANGGKVVLGAPITAVDYGGGSVKVTAGGKTYQAAAAVITLPLGVLKAGTVKFMPALPAAKLTAIKNLGMGTLNKVILQFPAAAKWPAGNWFSRMALPSDAGRWREFFSLRTVSKAAGVDRPVIVAFNAGKAARYPPSVSDAALVSEALAALRGMFGASLPAPTASWVTRWHDDPYSVGSYSNVPPGATGTERQELGKKTGTKLYWAGEAVHPKWPSTVQGAYATGEAAAAQIAKDLKPASG